MTTKKTFGLFFLCCFSTVIIYAANPAPDNRPAVRNARRAIIATENQIEAKIRGGLNLDHGVYFDNTDGVLTAWRWSSNKIWLPAGFVDPRHHLSDKEAFNRARSWPTSEHGSAIAISENH